MTLLCKDYVFSSRLLCPLIAFCVLKSGDVFGQNYYLASTCQCNALERAHRFVMLHARWIEDHALHDALSSIVANL